MTLTPIELYQKAESALAALPYNADLTAACAALDVVAANVPPETRAPAVGRCADFRASAAPTCEALVDKGDRCAPPDPGEAAPPPRDELVAACNAAVAAEPDQLPAMGACLIRSCEDYADCIDAARQGAKQGRRIDSITAAAESGQFRKVSFLCAEQASAGGDAQVLAACKDLADKAVAAWKPKLEARRAEGGDPELLCFDFQRLAGVVSPDVQREARDLCAEVTFGRAVRGTIEATLVAKNDLPYDCENVTAQLERNGSDWAKAAAQRVASACYLSLGARYLRLPGCPGAKSRVLDGLRRHGLTSDAIATLISDATKACGQ